MTRNHDPLLPSVKTCKGSSLSRKEIESKNEGVKHAINGPDSQLQPKGRKKYNDYTAEERARIGKYAAENGPTSASRYFTKLLGRKVPESCTRRFKSEYVESLKAVVRDRGSDMESVAVVVKSLPTKPQGRPLLLGQELDKAVQDYITAMRMVGGVVNTTIVMAAAEGIVSARDPSKLRSHGGHIHFTKAWAKSLLKRAGYVKRKCSNAGKVSVAHFEELKEVSWLILQQ